MSDIFVPGICRIDRSKYQAYQKIFADFSFPLRSLSVSDVAGRCQDG